MRASSLRPAAVVLLIVVGLIVVLARGHRSGETRAASTRPDESAFWQLIADTRGAAGNDTGRQAELIRVRLRKLSPRTRREFTRIRSSLDRRAYTWDLWGAAHVIEDGCSDDCFHDFRAYLISLGRGPYEDALANPDSLASVAQDDETGDWEDAFAAQDEHDLDGDPRGTPFDEDDDAGLAHRYPRLAERFR
jgi:Protein of unknown function (DUF4240)